MYLPSIPIVRCVTLVLVAAATPMIGCTEEAPQNPQGGGAGGTDSASGGNGAGNSGGSGGATSSSAGGGACDDAKAGTPCEVDGTTCNETLGQGDCERPRLTSCVDGRWEVRTALDCETYEPAPTCNIPGRYLVEPSGPFDPEGWLSEQYGEPFEVLFELGDDGLLYASAESGSVDLVTCKVALFWNLDEDCEDIEGESFCSYIDRRLDIDLSSDPATGAVLLECSGECGDTSTAPVTAAKL